MSMDSKVREKMLDIVRYLTENGETPLAKIVWDFGTSHTVIFKYGYDFNMVFRKQRTLFGKGFRWMVDVHEEKKEKG